MNDALPSVHLGYGVGETLLLCAGTYTAGMRIHGAIVGNGALTFVVTRFKLLHSNPASVFQGLGRFRAYRDQELMRPGSCTILASVAMGHRLWS